MGMKKECSCGYWNKEQEECLYNGHGCAKDEQNKLEITEEWIEDKVTNLFIFLNILKPSSNDVNNVKTFIRTLYREAGCQLKED